MRVTMSTVLKALAALPLLAASSISLQAQDAETLFREGRLAEKRDHPADSGRDLPHSGSRQGYGHIRQGNTSTDADVHGRAFNPYGGENAEQLLNRALDNNQLPAWELGVTLLEPRSIQIVGADGTTRTVWYVLYKVANRNVQPVREYKTGVIEINKTPSAGDAESAPSIEETGLDPSGAGEIKGSGGSGMLKPSFLVPSVSETGEWIGMPVSTSISLYVESVSGYDALAGNEDDLRTKIEAEVDRLIGSGADGADATRRSEMVEERMAKARRTYRDAADADLRRRIAEKEGLMEWRDSKFEPVISSSDAFKRDISPVYAMTSDYFDGRLGLPVVAETMAADGTLKATYKYPVVNEADGSFYDYMEVGQTLPSGTAMVREGHPLYGKLLKVQYREYDVVDRYGRPLSPADSGYHAARAAGGEITREKAEAKIPENLANLIGQTAKGPALRVYKEGDRVLNGWDTGVPTAPGSSDTFKIYGKIVPNNAAMQRAYASVLAELRTHARGASDAAVAGNDLVAAATRSMAESAIELSGGTEIFPDRRAAGDGIPVKQLDHLGRAVRRGLVTYQVGERITQVEYEAWAQRFPASVLARYDSKPWTRALRHDDLLVGLPKIKMGKLASGSENKGAKEEVKIGGKSVETGRAYDSRVIAPSDFVRDPDGEYFTNREAPVPEGASLRAGEAYAFAPMGAANEGAVPVPQFDTYGVWADYLDPVTGRPIPLRNANGEPVVDEMGQQLFVKEFQYECLYAYEYEREAEQDPNYAAGYTGTVKGIATTTMRAFMKDGKFVGPATWQIFTGTGDARRLDRLSIDDPGEVDKVSPDDYAQTAGYTVDSIKVPVTVLEGLRAGLAARSGQVPVQSIGANAFERSTEQYSNGWNPGDTIATSQRWTFPAPLVSTGSDGKLVVESALSLSIGPSGERTHHHFISEKWGVFILPDLDENWDFLNVSIRGLRAPVIRRGFAEKAYNVPTPVVSGEMRRTALDTVWVRQDWVYQARFEREGNAAKPETNNIHRISEGWRLMSEGRVE